MLVQKRILLIVFVVLVPEEVIAQSDPSNFTTIINIPSIAEGVSFNGTVDSDTQLNLNDGGTLSGDAGRNNGSSSNVEINIFDGFVHTNYRAWPGSTINLLGGTLGGGLFVHDGSTLVISGGLLDGNLRGQAGSVIEVFGGTVGSNSTTEGVANVSGGDVRLAATNGGVVNLSGGVASRDIAFGGGTANMTGGILGPQSEVGPGGILNLHGGVIRNEFSIRGGRANIFGGELRLDGVPIDGLASVGSEVTIELLDDELLTGTLTDGTPFALSPWNSNQFGGTPVRLISTALPPIGPALLTASIDPVPNGIRQGQTLVIDSGSTVQKDIEFGWGSNLVVEPGGVLSQPFGQPIDASHASIEVKGGTSSSINIYEGSNLNILPGSTVGSVAAGGASKIEVSGGDIAFVFVDSGSELELSGGVIGGLNAQENTRVNFSGGISTNRMLIESGAILNMSGGNTSGIIAFGESTANISGGTIQEEISASSGSTLNISGGDFLGTFLAESGSRVNLVGTQFILDGMDISGSLVQDFPILITERDVNLIAILKDGSRFDYRLSSVRNRQNPNLFATNSTLRLTLVESVPEPTAMLIAICGMTTVLSGLAEQSL